MQDIRPPQQKRPIAGSKDRMIEWRRKPSSHSPGSSRWPQLDVIFSPCLPLSLHLLSACFLLSPSLSFMPSPMIAYSSLPSKVMRPYTPLLKSSLLSIPSFFFMTRHPDSSEATQAVGRTTRFRRNGTKPAARWVGGGRIPWTDLVAVTRKSAD